MLKKPLCFTRILRSIGIALVAMITLWGLSVSMASMEGASDSSEHGGESANVEELVATMSDQEKDALFQASDFIYQIMMDSPSKAGFTVTTKTPLNDLFYRLKASEFFRFTVSIEHIERGPLAPNLKALIDKEGVTFKEFGLFIEQVRKAAHPLHRNAKV